MPHSPTRDPMRALAVALLAGVLLAGCSAVDETSDDERPLGPHVLVAVDDRAGDGHALAELLYEGAVIDKTEMTLEAGKVTEKPVTLRSNGTRTLRLTWDVQEAGAGASGTTEIVFDTTQCPGVIRTVFVLDIVDGRGLGSASSTCLS